MTTFSVFYTEQAYSDLEAIYAYIADKLEEPQTAQRLISRLTKAIDDLSFMADSYHFYDAEPYRSNGIHYFSEGNYSVFYKTDAANATVLRILYGARDFTTLL